MVTTLTVSATKTVNAKPSPSKPPVDPPVDPPEVTQRPLGKEEARNLLYAGHRLRKVTDTPEQRITFTRNRDERVLSQPLTEELEDQVLSNDLVLVD